MQPNPSTTTPVDRRRRARPIGLIVLVVGLVAGGLCWFLAGQQSSDAIADLAPAPVGCDTTLDFDSTGTYTFYVETSGEVGEIDGNCDGADRDYEFTGDGLPRVSLTLLDGDGDEVDLDRVESPTYDEGGARGTAIRTATIEDAGSYVLTVEANADDVMVRVGKGREPAGSSGMLQTLAIVLAAAGVVGGALLLVLGTRGRTPPVAPAGPAPQQWQPLPGQAPPNAPPTTAPNAPPYSWPPGTPPAPPSAPPQQGWGGSGSNPLPPPGR